MSNRTLRIFQDAMLVVGIVLLAVYALALADRSVSSRLALEAFDQAQAAAPVEAAVTPQPLGNDTVDVSLWSETRIRRYEKGRSIENRLPLAVLDIGKLGVRVPVFEGTDNVVLNRGVGWIIGATRPGEKGNIGIAGHRDSFFRGLKDIAVGDSVELTTLGARATYVVDQIAIVSPDSVEVLRPRSVPSLTLVTCYPFYFVGDAPQRFIVHAALERTVPTRPPDQIGR